MNELKVVIKSVFNEFDPGKFSLGLELGQIPGWDSMNSVNLQMAIQSKFNVQFGDFSLNDYHKVSDIVNFLKGKGIVL